MMTAERIERPGLTARGWRLLGSRSGVMAITTGGNLVVRVASSVVLTRLLSPDAFGIVGIISAVFFAVFMLTDLGFQSYVTRHADGDDRHFRDVIWPIHAGRGVAITLIAIGLAPIVAHVLRKPELAWPLAIASFTLLLNGLASLSLVTALREDRARRLSWLELGLAAFQAAASIALALVLRSFWAIVAAMLLQALLRLVLSYALFPGSASRPARDRAISREFLAFSRVVVTSSAVSLAMSQTDKLVLARLFTLAQFGLYAIAVNLASAPAAFADGYVHRVVFPALARTWQLDRGAIPGVFYRMRRTVTLLYAFGSGGLIGGAGLLVAILYDPRYQFAASYLSLLAIGTAFRMPNVAAAELMAAMGEINVTLRANLARLGWLAIAGVAGYLALGPIGLVAAVGTVELAPYLYSCAVLRRAGVLDLREEGAFLLALAAGAGLGYLIAATALWVRPGL